MVRESKAMRSADREGVEMSEKEKADRYDSLQLAIKLKIKAIRNEIDKCASVLAKDEGAVTNIDCVILGQKVAFEGFIQDLEMWV